MSSYPSQVYWPYKVMRCHVHCHFVGCNAKLLACKRIPYRPLYTTMCLYLCMWPCSLTENISECRLVYHTQVISIRYEVNRAIEPIKPLQTSALELFVYHCALYLWNVNYTTCAPTPPGVQWFTCIRYLASRELMQAGTSIFWHQGS